MMIESFVSWWVLGNFSMIPHVFLVFSIDSGFNVCCVCVFNVFVYSVKMVSIKKSLKVCVLKAKRKMEQSSQSIFDMENMTGLLQVVDF
jgi:hypothetical protein